jgi:hypothetical protein
LTELKLINLRFKEPDLMTEMIKCYQSDFKLQSISLSKLNLDARCIDELVKVLENRPSCLKELDISWNKMSSNHLEKIFKAIRTNQYIRSLNVSFNPISRSSRIKDLSFFVRNNPNLQHLNLSGVLQTPFQVTKMIKKAKKAQSLLSLHLSHTSIDDHLTQYILDKLLAVDHRSTASLSRLYPRMNERLDWKEKYELV